MRVVLQRVSRASVTWAGGHSQIGSGFVILIGIGPEDTEATAVKMAEKVCRLRVFADSDGRMNRSLDEVGGAALVVSQFTLYADLSRGRRPGFVGGAPPALADRLYRRFAEALGALGIGVETGSFGSEMEVEIINDGPVTLVISSDELTTRSPGLS